MSDQLELPFPKAWLNGHGEPSPCINCLPQLPFKCFWVIKGFRAKFCTPECADHAARFYGLAIHGEYFESEDKVRVLLAKLAEHSKERVKGKKS